MKNNKKIILIIALICISLFSVACTGFASKKDGKDNKDIANHNIEYDQNSYEYSGEEIQPRVFIEGLSENKDFEVEYPKECKNVGKYVITIKGIGKYNGEVKKEFRILPYMTSISKIKKGKESFYIKWNEKITQVDGYNIQYSTMRYFDEKESFTVDDKHIDEYTITSLKAKQKYYVRIRTYKVVDGKKIYSHWSLVKKVKTK